MTPLSVQLENLPYTFFMVTLPPVVSTEEGGIRRVGLEFEFGGIDVGTAAAAIIGTFGGEIEVSNTFVQRVRGTPFGVFEIELDSGVLKKKRYKKPMKALGITTSSEEERKFEDRLGRIFSTVVPVEIVTPPIPVTRLDAIAKLEDALRACGALGTKASLLYAFGVHINVEAPAGDVLTIIRYVKAFSLLYAWIYRRVDVDLLRYLSPYIDRYPDEYVRLILDEDYSPELEEFTEDYLRFNPTRNRALDLLPLLAFHDEERVRGVVGFSHKITPRPAFHYRMPNCSIDDPTWSALQEWETWVAVELLAEQPEQVSKLSRAYFESQRHAFPPFYNPWSVMLEEFMGGPAPGSKAGNP